MTHGTVAPTLRLLLVGAPVRDEAWTTRILAQAGLRVERAAASDAAEAARLLLGPLDLVLLWIGPDAPDPSSVLDLVRQSARRLPVALVQSSEAREEALGLVQEGVCAVVSIDRPAQLVALARRCLVEARRGEVIGLARATCHDLNNLLAVVPLAGHSLRSRLADPSDRRLLESIEQAAAQATAAVDSLYRVALWSEGDEASVKGGVALRHLIEAVAGRVRGAFAALEVETDYAPDLGRVAGSPRELRQALLCLALGAAEACGGDGALRIAVREHPDGRRVLVAVSVTGAAGLSGEPLALSDLAPTVESLGAELGASRSERGISYLLTLPLEVPTRPAPG